MTQPDHSARRGPKRRSDTTRPASIPSGPRQGGDRRPYPTASTTTRVSPAKPGSARIRSRSRGSAATPTPSTVWTAGPAPIELDTTWPSPIITKIVDSFSEPGATVALLPWPTPADRLRLASVGAAGVIGQVRANEPGAELADALAAVEELDRTGRVVRVPADATMTGPGARPFWADLVDDPGDSGVTAFPPLGEGVADAVPGGVEDASADTDLIITSLRPGHGGDRSSDLVALVAARLLRVGGILVVFTHGDWSSGELIDPSGAVVASAQNADLLYLQHIVVLHTPVQDGRFASESLAEPDSASSEAQHRAAVRGLPAPHQRIHSNALVFAQPHDHQLPRQVAAKRSHTSGVIR